MGTEECEESIGPKGRRFCKHRDKEVLQYRQDVRAIRLTDSQTLQRWDKNGFDLRASVVS